MRRERTRGGIGRALVAFLVAAGCGAGAQEANEARPEENGVPAMLRPRPATDYGPFFSYSLVKPTGDGKAGPQKPKKAVSKAPVLNKPPKDPFGDAKPVVAKVGKDIDTFAAKGITIKLDNAGQYAVCFDTDLVRMAAGWKGGFLDLSKSNVANYKGSTGVMPGGPVLFQTNAGPGWGRGDDFAEHRMVPHGPLVHEQAHYRGLFVNGDKVVLSYTVGKCEVLESPGVVEAGSDAAFSRSFRMGPSREPLTLVVADVDGATSHKVEGGVAGITGKDAVTSVAATGLPAGAKVDVIGGSRIVLRLPALSQPVNFAVLIAVRPHGNGVEMPALLAAAGQPQDLTELCRGGPMRWNQTLNTKGTLGFGTAGYVLDTLTLPSENPWNSWMRPAAIDFFPDGRLVVATMGGDVWVVSNVDEKLGKLYWKRYATGLFEPMGVRVVNDTIYVSGKDQITRLRDLNGDGEADAYDNFNNDCVVVPGYHSWAFETQTDSKGNFYFAKDGNAVRPGWPLHGVLLRVSPDGGKLDVVATGFRTPNGVGIGPDDEITVSDNQGNWTPANRLNWVKPGGFYGYVGDPTLDPDQPKKPHPTTYDPPLCWMPQVCDNSPGSQVWVTTDKWGPMKGQMLHTSYGRATLMSVMFEDVGGVKQGGVVKFPIKFPTGIMRARFNPIDGQLYVCGLKGWQTDGPQDGGVYRVRYVGGAANMPVGLHARANGMEIVFSDPVDPRTAGDEQSYGIEQWNYQWTAKYGSPDFSVSEPTKKGHDEVEVKSAKVLEDGKTVFLEIPGVRPVMQMKIDVKIKGKDGRPISCEIFNTINKVGAAK